MMERNTRLWLSLLAAAVVMIAFLLRLNSINQTTSIPNIEISKHMANARTPFDVMRDTESVEKMIGEMWQTTEFSSDAPSIKIVSILTNGEGCKTYVYDGDGNLLSKTEANSRDIESDANPFGNPGR